MFGDFWSVWGIFGGGNLLIGSERWMLEVLEIPAEFIYSLSFLCISSFGTFSIFFKACEKA